MSTMQKLLGDELTTALQQAVKTVATAQADQVPPDPFHSPIQRALQIEQELKDAFEKNSKTFIEVATILKDTVKLLSQTRNDINYEEVMQELLQQGQQVNADTWDLLAFQVTSMEQADPQMILNYSETTLQVPL